jgi:Ni/Co efflux regulator RcnB
MKRLITAVLALTLLGGTAASAATFYNLGPFPPGHVHVRYMPRHHAWVRGDYFTMPYGRYIVVSDWHRHHLRRPPVGYRWVRYGDELLLVARRTGLILDVRFASF